MAQDLGLDVVDTLILSGLPLEKKLPDSWPDLNNILSEGSGLFDETSTNQYIIDIQSLVIDTKSIILLEQLAQKLPDFRIYFYSSTENSLGSDAKKLWLKAEFEYTVLKSKDAGLVEQIADRYSSKIGLTLEQSELTTIIKQSQNYSELIDNLDFVSLAGDKKEAIKSLISEEKVPIFVLGFDPAKLETQVKRWYTEIGEDEIQLALSLIFGKLDKNKTGEAKELIKKLILTDQKIKTRSKVSPLVWYRLMLWESVSI